MRLPSENELLLSSGEPSYLTTKTKSGTTIRVHWKERRADRCAMYVHCQTNLVQQYRLRHADELEFEGNRAVLFPIDSCTSSRSSPPASYALAARIGTEKTDPSLTEALA